MNPRHSLSLAFLLAFSSAGLLHCATDVADDRDDDIDPVTENIDSATGALTKTFIASADTEVAQASPTKNFGTVTKFGVDSDPVRHGYVKFDVSGISGTVNSAKIRCYAWNGSTDGPAVYTTSSSWGETTLTWNNKPAASGAALSDVGAVTYKTWVEFDVTKAVKTNGAASFVFIPTSTDSVECASREDVAETRPQLVVTYTPPPPPPPTKLTCPTGFATEVWRDDFDGTALDANKWQVVVQNNSSSGGAFTQLTKMLAENATVSGGKLHVASKRHCEDPYVNRSAAEHPAKCAGTNYYSGAWLKGKTTYAPGKGVMSFLAKIPAPQPGVFPALWARNSFGDTRYGELDLIETSWDAPKGKQQDVNVFIATTHLQSASIMTSNNGVGPFANLVTKPHVFEVEWDANAAVPNVKYYYRDELGSARILLRTVTASSPGISGRVSADNFKTILSDGYRPYIDFAVSPDNPWTVSPDVAATYNPEDLEVDSVIVCKP